MPLGSSGTIGYNILTVVKNFSGLYVKLVGTTLSRRMDKEIHSCDTLSVARNHLANIVFTGERL